MRTSAYEAPLARAALSAASARAFLSAEGTGVVAPSSALGPPRTGTISVPTPRPVMRRNSRLSIHTPPGLPGPNRGSGPSDGRGTPAAGPSAERGYLPAARDDLRAPRLYAAAQARLPGRRCGSLGRC